VEPAIRRVRATDGLELAVVDFGGRGPTLLFSHATGFHAFLWEPHARRFAATHRVLAIEHRGHGRSDKPATGYRWERFGADLAAVVRALGLRDVRAVGHSKGAMAIVIAVGLGAPIVRAVLIEPVLIAGPPRTEPAMESPLAQGALRRRTTFTSRDDMFARLRPRMPFETWREEFVRCYVDHGVADRPDGGVELLCPGAIEAQVYANAPMSDSYALLERCTVPTLLVRGATGPGIDAMEEAEALRRLPDGRAVVIAGGGHFVPMERPDEVAAAIAGFVG
jgi:pimeloyl-ACP methyl ester carboxylesterase